MFRKNVAGQVIHFQGVDSATGGIKSGVTWTVRRCIDGTFAAGGGTVTEDGTTGWYKYAMSQADTNGNNIGFNFTGTGAIPQTVNIITTAADPTDAVRLGLTALPNANAEAAGGLYTRGTGAGQINQPADGQVDVNAVKVGGTTQTAGDIIADTNDIQARLPAALVSGRIDSSVGAMAANVLTSTAINDDAITDAKVASDVTIASVTGSVGSVTAGVTVATNNDKTGYSLSAAAVQAIWDALTSALTTAGSIGKWILDKLDVVVSTRLAAASYTAPLDAAGTRSAIGLASANLDTQLSTIDDFLDTEIAAIKAKTDNLPSDPADASDIAAAFGTVNSSLSTIDTGVTAIQAKTDNLPASPAATGDIPTTNAIADEVWSIINNTAFPFPTTPVIDNFNRADEGPPPSANWTTGIANGFGGFLEPGHSVVGNQLNNDFNDVAQNYWNSDSFGPDCEAYITVVDVQGLVSVGLAARLTDIGRFTCEGYAVQINPSGGGANRTYQIFRIDNGVLTLLSNSTEDSVGSMDGDKYGIRCIGNNIQLWADTGEGWRLKLSVTDSTHTGAGAIGIVTESDPLSRWDDFGGGHIVFPSRGALLFNASVIADAVWDEDIVSEHQTADSAGKKLSQALVLYEGN